MQHHISPTVQSFFQEFERAGNTLDVPVILSEFHDPFMSIDPGAVHIVTREMFSGALQKRKGFFDSLGLKHTTVTPIEETIIDDRHVLVKTSVVMTFEKSSGEKPIIVEQFSRYLLRKDDHGYVIVLYHNEAELMTVMKNAGLLPG
jgi:hypothetical protein